MDMQPGTARQSALDRTRPEPQATLSEPQLRPEAGGRGGKLNPQCWDWPSAGRQGVQFGTPGLAHGLKWEGDKILHLHDSRNK